MKWTLKICGIPLRHFFSQIQLRDTVLLLSEHILFSIKVMEGKYVNVKCPTFSNSNVWYRVYVCLVLFGPAAAAISAEK